MASCEKCGTDEIDLICEGCRWISVEDRLPEYGVAVLVIPKDYPNDITAAILVFHDEGWVWEEYARYGFLNDPDNYELDDEYNYTHWMPLPPTPREEDADE